MSHTHKNNIVDKQQWRKLVKYFYKLYFEMVKQLCLCVYCRLHDCALLSEKIGKVIAKIHHRLCKGDIKRWF